MSTEKKICLNCGYELAEEAMYCAKCGQKYSEKNGTVQDFFVDFLGDYFTFDSKIFRSIIPLIIKPGFLTTEYLIGRRVRYIPPLRLYIFISIIFFLIFRFANPASGTMMDEENMMSQNMFDYFLNNHWHKVFFVLLPLFALIVFLFYRRVYKKYLPHFIFSLHFHSFLFILLSCYLLVTTYITQRFAELNLSIFFVFTIFCLLYLFFALKNVFKESLVWVCLKLIGIGIIYTFINLGASILALAVYYQLKS